MARPYRLQLEDCLYHVTSKGDDRKKVFISERDYEKFQEYVRVAKGKYKFYVYAYCLMTNHYHFLLETTQPNISRIMQYINTSYAAYYNVKRKKVGHVFQGRYKSIIVDGDNYFLELTRYIHLNPVRAKIVREPGKYRWSSYKGYVNRGGDSNIDKKQISKYTNLKGEKYRDFILDGIGKKADFLKDIYAGFILGKSEFIKGRLKDLKDRVEGKDFSYKSCMAKTVDKEAIIKVVVERYCKSFEDICQSKKRPMIEKQTAIFLMRRLTDLTNREIGNIFGMKYHAVSKAEHAIEKLMKINKGVDKEIKRLVSTFDP